MCLAVVLCFPLRSSGARAHTVPDHHHAHYDHQGHHGDHDHHDNHDCQDERDCADHDEYNDDDDDDGDDDDDESDGLNYDKKVIGVVYKLPAIGGGAIRV